MSKEKSKKEQNQSSIDIKSLLIGLLAATVIGLLIYVFATDTGDSNTTDNTKLPSSVDELVADSYKRVNMTDDDINHAKGMLENVFNTIRTKNGFYNVAIGSEDNAYDSYYYSKNGEIFAIGNLTGYCTVYRKDMKAVVYTDVLYEDYAIDTITLLENALAAVGKVKGVKMYEYVSDLYDISDALGMYDIEITSWDGVKALYEPVDEEFAEDMIAEMKDAMPSNWSPAFNLKLNVTNEGSFAAQCTTVVDGVTYTQWVLDGYATLYDWELGEEWYTLDIGDGEKCEETLKNFMEYLGEMVERYMEENPGLIVPSDETVTDNGDGTHTHEDGTVHENTELETNDSASNNEDENTVVIEGTVDIENSITREEADKLLDDASKNSTEDTESDENESE